MRGLPGFHDLREEILERIWLQSQNGETSLGPVQELGEASDIEGQLRALEEDGLIRRSAGSASLTREGENLARHVVRAHRLAARLLTDLLELPPESIENLACRLEHAISPELADNLCTLLGHPPTAPGGEPVPPGECCKALKNGVTPAVRQLPELNLGSRGRITFIHPRFAQRLEQLSGLGLVPGTDVRLKQHRPSIVVEVGETTLALDTEVARDIFVKPI
jgi:DtxR family Mn-dependent transcriptional regulator